ncbi:MAG: DNA polymerase III subunit alpha, partial [Fimbriimonadaceae bacterium]|nr:DNA polymerase III subunit alpha [Fimbriimonadaceae bacterium]
MLPVCVTNDSHYLCQTDSTPHDVLLAIGTGAKLSEPDRFYFKQDNKEINREYYMKSPEEMAALFPHLPEAMENTAMIADLCSLELGKEENLMPQPELEPGHDERSYLRHLAEKGIEDRMPRKSWEEAKQRLDYELDVIHRCGFDSYFLLVREFASFTRNQGISFGVRGSAAGSLVAYTTGITDVDPLEFDLTFERFLNPERVSMPDIDMDFEDARRDEVIRWVGERYGRDHVAQIVTFGSMKAKAAVKDAARVMEVEPKEADRIAKMIPEDPKMTLDKALTLSPDLRQAVEREPVVRRVVETAKSIEGIRRHTGVHAAGVVISGRPLADIVPLYRTNEGQPVTAYEMGILEKLGLLKMDFLGLINLTVVARAIDHIRAREAGRKDQEALFAEHPVLKDGVRGIPFDNQAAYDLLARGDTVGVFQLESGGMRRNIISLKPNSIAELSAMVALYRPGPMDQIPVFIDRKFGRKPIEYLHPMMEPILKETYGVIVYQEQVQKLAQTLAGFSLGKGDNLRRAMGKKKLDELEKMKPEFFEGCAARDVSAETAQKVWDLLLPFADYAFNKAHAVCYAILAYQTAYLKANYPVEYMCALLACYRDKGDRAISALEECRRMGLHVQPPDVNRSQADFSIDRAGAQAVIRFGLAGIKGVGEGMAERLIAEREANGPYRHLFDVAFRLRRAGLNKGTLEAFIQAGALDGLHDGRSTMLA